MSHHEKTACVAKGFLAFRPALNILELCSMYGTKCEVDPSSEPCRRAVSYAALVFGWTNAAATGPGFEDEGSSLDGALRRVLQRLLRRSRVSGLHQQGILLLLWNCISLEAGLSYVRGKAFSVMRKGETGTATVALPTTSLARSIYGKVYIILRTMMR